MMIPFFTIISRHTVTILYQHLPVQLFTAQSMVYGGKKTSWKSLGKEIVEQ